MKSYKNLYSELCSYENLELAFKKARKRKALKDYVIEVEADLENNLKQPRHKLESFMYCPRPLTTLAIKDLKTRKISASPISAAFIAFPGMVYYMPAAFGFHFLAGIS